MAPPFNREKFLRENPGRESSADDPNWVERLYNSHPHYFTEESNKRQKTGHPIVGGKRTAAADSSQDATPSKVSAGNADSSQSSSIGNTSSYLSPSGSSVSSTSGSGEPNIDAEMVLPGTAGEMASGGANGGMAFEYKTPESTFGKKVSTYRKMHKFMTFGFASNFINIPSGTPATVQGSAYLTTYLAEIPWHIPAFYMNQSEYDLLPDGSHVKEIRVTVTYRDRTIQFQTAQSGSNVATLNQKGDIAVAHGLNRTGWGQNVRYTAWATADEPMIPTSCTKPVYDVTTGVAYRGMVADYYGADNKSANFLSYIPKHQLGRECFLYNYWALNTRVATSTTALFPFNMYGGIPNISARIKQMDGKTMVNKVIAHSIYKPKQSPLKKTLRTYKCGLPWPKDGDTFTVSVQGEMIQSRNAGITVTNASTGTTTDATVNITGVAENQSDLNNSTGTYTFNIYSPIEKSQFIRSGQWGQPDAHIQPSLHIGIQPVPALSSNATIAESVFNSWTENRAYFDVLCEMDVVEYLPTEFPFAKDANVTFSDNLMINASNRPAVNFDPRNDGATINGLYFTGFDTNLPS